MEANKRRAGRIKRAKTFVSYRLPGSAVHGGTRIGEICGEETRNLIFP